MAGEVEQDIDLVGTNALGQLTVVNMSYCQKLLMAEFQAAAVWGFNPSMN